MGFVSFEPWKFGLPQERKREEERESGRKRKLEDTRVILWIDI